MKWLIILRNIYENKLIVEWKMGVSMLSELHCIGTDLIVLLSWEHTPMELHRNIFLLFYFFLWL